jgi:hypothetical protein
MLIHIFSRVVEDIRACLEGKLARKILTRLRTHKEDAELITSFQRQLEELKTEFTVS